MCSDVTIMWQLLKSFYYSGSTMFYWLCNLLDIACTLAVSTHYIFVCLIYLIASVNCLSFDGRTENTAAVHLHSVLSTWYISDGLIITASSYINNTLITFRFRLESYVLYVTEMFSFSSFLMFGAQQVAHGGFIRACDGNSHGDWLDWPAFKPTCRAQCKAKTTSSL